MGEEVVLIKISLILPIPALSALLIPVTVFLDQFNTEPATQPLGLYWKAVPLQIALGVVVLLNLGVGFTFTVTISVFEHPLEVTVNAY